MSTSDLFQEEFSNKELTNAEIINKRRVINGYDDGLMQIAPLKHPWAYEIFNTMVKNTWVPQEVPLQSDVSMWESGQLTEQERTVFERSLAFVSNLDGLQTNNLACNIIRHITSPEVILAVTRQTYEEALQTLAEAEVIWPEIGKSAELIEIIESNETPPLFF